MDRHDPNLRFRKVSISTNSNLSQPRIGQHRNSGQTPKASGLGSLMYAWKWEIPGLWTLKFQDEHKISMKSPCHNKNRM